MKCENIIVCDTECYRNYFLIMFQNIKTKCIAYFEMFKNDFPVALSIREQVTRILNSGTIVTFNGNKYDMPLLQLFIAGANIKTIHGTSGEIIHDQLQPWTIEKRYKIASHHFDHIDLIEIAPLKASLKIYGARLHSKKMQDLPVDPDKKIKKSQSRLLKKYCKNDLAMTGQLYRHLIPEIKLRQNLSRQYRLDLRSKSDAQIAEAAIKQELLIKYGITIRRPKIKTGTQYHYKAPSNIKFTSVVLQNILHEFTTSPFFVNEKGSIDFNFSITDSDKKRNGALPLTKKKLKFKINDTTYAVGVGGLHSQEKSVHYNRDRGILREYDVASYYPRIVLNNRIHPQHIGTAFLSVYNDLVTRRLRAKRNGNTTANESLKITINGSFGKFGSRWSSLYSPDLLMRVTVTGQLTLLMLIESLESAHIRVVSANTDGIVVMLQQSQSALCDEIVSDWEWDTDYQLEFTDYTALYSRDVNNYIALTKKSVKAKGAYADRNSHFYMLRSNPVNQICVTAVIEFIKNGIDIKKTIETCDDVTQFLTVRNVTGGAIKNGVLIGKAIRWYYSNSDDDAIYYAKNGNKVPKSDHGVPLLDLPDTLPCDLNTAWYITESKKILNDIGYFKTNC